jgi:hypothetical protein
LRPVEKDSMLKKRLEAEAEMWDLWRMGEEEEAVSSEDTDFACRCVKKAREIKSNRIKYPLRILLNSYIYTMREKI